MCAWDVMCVHGHARDGNASKHFLKMMKKKKERVQVTRILSCMRNDDVGSLLNVPSRQVSSSN